MLIDIPVFISFNADRAESAYRCGSQVFGSTFTLRFDPEDSDVPASFVPHYPPRPGDKFWPFEANSIFEFMPRNTEKRLIELANSDPESYFVDQEMARLLEEGARADREANGQFGVGA